MKVVVVCCAGPSGQSTHIAYAHGQVPGESRSTDATAVADCLTSNFAHELGSELAVQRLSTARPFCTSFGANTEAIGSRSACPKGHSPGKTAQVRRDLGAHNWGANGAHPFGNKKTKQK